MLDLFRASDQAGVVTEQALALRKAGNLRFSVLWMQLGVKNEEAREKAEAAGVQVMIGKIYSC